MTAFTATPEDATGVAFSQYARKKSFRQPALSRHSLRVAAVEIELEG